MYSVHLLPSMLGGVTLSSVIREILGEGRWTLCQNHGAASQRHAYTRVEKLETPQLHRPRVPASATSDTGCAAPPRNSPGHTVRAEGKTNAPRR